MRFSLAQCLTLVLVVALVLGLLTNHIVYKRQINSLRTTIDDSRSVLRKIEYGRANLQLLSLNPAIWNDRNCSQFLKHDLAISILTHWREQDTIDDAVGQNGYALEFARDALSFFECKSADDFVGLARSELSVDPSDELPVLVSELNDSEYAALDDFIRTATTETDEGG
ncbi:hypothetical protein LOC67_24745 [Stieleria sp. JC731]|uniref:hypothetical protein n=1 Tax=Stieleria sp. JC731 TaxID=2894195 RepID=UPI001E49A58C|nr:hypothetical protein [Stieleria sp. JC731]MCC9603772.1 hypothetical protein [Stieleria sp. JC731]